MKNAKTLLKQIYGNVLLTLRSPIFDQTASLTLSTLMGIVPIFLLILFCIYHVPALNKYQENIEQFLYLPLTISQTKGAIMSIKSMMPSILNFPSSTLISLVAFAYFFIFCIAHTLSKITQQQHQLPLHVKLFALLFMIFITISIISFYQPTWLAAWWFPIILKTSSLLLLFIALLPDHHHFSIAKALTTTVVLQTLISHLFIDYYSYFHNYHLIYGQLAGYVILISWIYVSWSIITLILFWHVKGSNK